MEFVIRAARAGDAAGIAAVHTASWAETYRGLMPDGFLDRMTSEGAREQRAENWRRTILEEREVVWVAEQDGVVVAFASAGPPRDHPGIDTELFTLYSLKRVQGRGIGRALLRAMAQALYAGGARNLALWVLDANPTRAWYARQGAHEAGEKVQPIPGGELREVRMAWPDLSALLE